MQEDKSSYKSIMKATSLFGGVQVFNIIIAIVRSKIIAVLLGPAGMGIAGLLTSTISLISSLTNFGLGTSGVKNIAAANAINNTLKISKTVIVLRRLVWITGLFGSIVTYVFSNKISYLTFGNEEYELAFKWLSITLLLLQLSKGQLAILQGLRRIKYLAKANLLGSTVGLVLSIPLYYKYGVDGIVPAMIISAIITLLFSWYFSNKVEFKVISVSLKRTIFEGKGMLYLGVMISMSSIISLAASYGVRIFISYNGGLNEVGFFNAGFDIVNGYMGIILVAIAADYFPRLASVAKDNKLCKKAMNQQAEIALLLLSPLIIIFIVFIHWIVILMYSSKFSEIDLMIQWASIGLLFKAASWVIAYVFLAKGAGKLYFLNELISAIYITILNLLGYKFLGLEGLGISFLIGYIMYFIQVLVLTKLKYNFSFDYAFKRILLISLFFSTIALLTIKFMPNAYSLVTGIVVLIITIYYSYYEIDKRLDIKLLINNFRNKK